MTDQELERANEVSLQEWRKNMMLRKKSAAIEELVNQLWASMKVIDRIQKRIEALERIVDNNQSADRTRSR